MQDQLLTCQNCGNPFVYSVYEQIANKKKATDKGQNPTTPNYCPICTSIKANEAKHPPKPTKS